MKIEIAQGDITQFAGDAIVNAANVVMLGGGGVDGAIHRKAGAALKHWIVQNIPADKNDIRCPTGQARATPGFGLPATYIIHTVGPIFHNSSSARHVYHPGEIVEKATLKDIDPRDLLASAIRESLKLADANNIKTLAMPAISCGVFGCPIVTFAKVLSEIAQEQTWSINTLTVVLYQDDELMEFQGVWAIVKPD